MSKLRKVKPSSRRNIQRHLTQTTKQEELQSQSNSVPDVHSMSASQILHLQQTIGNRAVQRLIAEQAGGDKSASQKHTATHTATIMRQQSSDENRVENADVHQTSNQEIQRRIYFNNTEANLSEVFSVVPYGKKRVIASNWHWAKMIHKFEADTDSEAKDKLIAAIDKVADQSSEPPSLFQQSNLMFVTKASGRQPTLYFRQGNDTGRLRQQHPSGPTLAQETNKTDYFFQSQEAARQFAGYARNVYKRQRKGENARLNINSFKRRYDITTVPATGMYHFELTGDLDAIEKRHLSGGTIDTNIDIYTSEKIKSIYQSVLGTTT